MCATRSQISHRFGDDVLCSGALYSGISLGDPTRFMTLNDAENLLAQFPARRIAVVGDFMLDRYVWGTASRISAEAPVPVVAVDRESAEPGGAANVLRNLVTLGAAVVPFGMVGEDAAGETLRGLLEELGADCGGILTAANRPTTQKTRVLAGAQQVVRIDREDRRALNEDEGLLLLEALAKAAAEGAIDGVIVEDYAKGVVTEDLLRALCEWASKEGIPVMLDPHPAHAYRIKGLTAMTPNRVEAFALAGAYFHDGHGDIAKDAPLLEVVERLEADWGPKYLLVTLGANGMGLFIEGRPALHVPTKARDVYDVSGAGDTVIAAFTLALAAGATGDDAAVFANHAAGVVVGKVGTAPVYPDEILATFA